MVVPAESGASSTARHPTLTAIVDRVHPVDQAMVAAAAAHQLRLTKPPGSLGRLEDVGARLAAIAGVVPPPVPVAPAVAVFAGDHGVVAQGVTPWPQEVTAQMVANFCAGGAAINVLARRCGAGVTVVDVGTIGDHVDHPTLRRRKVRPGTADLRVTSAMTAEEAVEAIAVGAQIAEELVAAGADLLVGGEMGIGNTTASAAVIAALTGRPADAVTGRGTGIGDATLTLKTDVVADALTRLDGRTDPIVVLAEVGGLELGALAGFYLGAGRARVPVVVDGVIAVAAALIAAAVCPSVVGYLIAGHRSTEPGATVGLAALGLEPVFELELRLGEGSGAALAVPVIQAAAALMGEMATFDAAGITEG